MPVSPTAQLASELLGVDVGEFILDRRRGGKSFRALGLEIRDLTGARVSVTEMTLRKWAREAEAAEAMAS